MSSVVPRLPDPKLGDSHTTLESPQTGHSFEKQESSSNEIATARITLATAKVDQVQTQSVTGQDWTGPNDPGNPKNWSIWRRIYHTTIPACSGFVVTVGSSTYAPGLSSVMTQFNVSETVALLGISLYVLGLAFGPVLAAPVSESFGRKPVYLISLILSACFTIGGGFSQTFASLVICRFFAGFFGSPTLAIGAGTSADIWEPVDRAPATVMFVLAPFAGPALGPVIGGYAAQAKGWRWTQWLILFLGALALAYSIFMDETYKKIILRDRARKLGISASPVTGHTGFAAVKVLITITLLRPIHMLFTEPIVGLLSLYVSFNFAVLYSFFTSLPLVFQGVYGFGLGETGLTYLPILIGCLFSCVTVIAVDCMRYRKEHQLSHRQGRLGFVAPEKRLYAAMIGSLGLPIGLFWFAWTARREVQWISPVLATIPFAWGNLCVFTSAALYLVDVYGPLTGASAMAANGLLRYLSAAAFPLFTVQMYEKLGIAWATSLLGFASLGLLPIPWLFFFYGPKIRSMSKYETIRA